MTECLYCKGRLEARRVTRAQQHGDHWYIIENLPAPVCNQCGAVFYAPEAHDRVIDLITNGADPVRVEAVAVLDAS